MKFTATRTGNEYELKFNEPSMYGGIYMLGEYVEDMYSTVCSILNVNPLSTDKDWKGLDHDASEISAFALLQLTSKNIELVSVNGELTNY